jgi:hypothetical protein
MDNILKRKLYEYVLNSRSGNPISNDFDLKISSNMSLASPDIRDFVLDMTKKGFSTDEIVSMVEEMWEPLNQEIADHLRNLLKEREVSTSSFGERSFLSDAFVRQVLAGKKHLSKETMFGLCLYLELTRQEVDEFLRIYGIELGKSIEDVTFGAYIDKKIYKLRDYVDDCVRIANASGVKLPGFFYKEYTNDTYRQNSF